MVVQTRGSPLAEAPGLLPSTEADSSASGGRPPQVSVIREKDTVARFNASACNRMLQQDATEKIKR